MSNKNNFFTDNAPQGLPHINNHVVAASGNIHAEDYIDSVGQNPKDGHNLNK